MLRTTFVAGGLLLAGVASAWAPLAGESSPSAPHGTNFFSDCRFSHSAPDDPIVRPGLPGASHPHEFFGNTSTDARSSLRSLLAHGTTCLRKADTAAYWVPALYRNGHVVKPLDALIYYRIRSIDPIHPFPPGLKIVAGNAGATAPQSTESCCGIAPTRLARSSRPHRSRTVHGGGREWCVDPRRGTSA
jgi:Domain of unknown function (DUF1996)